MATDALELANDMLENIKSLMKQIEELEKERDEWKNLCIEVHDAYKLSTARLENTRSEVIRLQGRVSELKEELYQARNSRNVTQIGISQDDLKRIRRYVHPDFTQKETGDLFRTVNGMIK